MNNKPFLAVAPLDAMQQSCVALLEETLELARDGKISSVAILACHVDGLAAVMAGKQGADLSLACDHLKHEIHDAIFGDGNVASRKQSRILRAR